VAPAEGTPSGFGLIDVAVQDREHPITAGLGAFERHADALLPVEAAGGDVLATTRGGSVPVLAAGLYGEGRTAAITLGNVAFGRPETWVSQRDPQFQQLVVRTVEWAATGAVTAMRRVEPNTLGPRDRAEGWRLLFDGSSVSGWQGLGGSGFPEDTWVVEDGRLMILPGGEDGGDIVTVETFDEYELELEWRVAEGSEYVESGLSIGVDGERMSARGFDVSLDSRADHPLGWELLRPPGEYNHVRILARRNLIQHWLNGVRVLTLYIDPGELAERLRGKNLTRDPELSRTPFGHIALKNRGTAIWFRNIKIRALPPEHEDATAPDTARIEIFNERDLSGWTWVPKVSPSDPVPFSVGKHGTLLNQGPSWGYLRLDGEYRDFVLELDWRHDPHTRSIGEASVILRGRPIDLGIWYRGVDVMIGGDSVGNVWRRGGFEMRFDVGRREGDVLRRLPRRYIPRPPEQWNHLEIRLQEGDLLVKVNGEVLNAADGLEQEAGMIALLAEGGPLEYRNLRLRPLD